MAFCGQCGTKNDGMSFCAECGAATGATPQKSEKQGATKTTPPYMQAEILAELWVDYKKEPEFEDFVSFNDIGLPLAYAVAYGIVETTELAEKLIGETWNLLLEAYGLVDTGFDTLDEVFGIAEADEFKADD